MNGARRHILVVDDDHAHLQSTKGILESEGYQVTIHDQPFGSTQMILRTRPDLVLLDVNMPGLSGDRLIDVYRANGQTRNVRVLLYSSNDEDSLRELATKLQLDGYICKGSPSELRRRVASALARV